MAVTCMNSDTTYFDSYHQIDGYRIIYPDENVIRFLVAHFPASARAHTRVLDLGCGSGRHLILLCELGFKAFGVDFSSVGLDYARSWLARRNFSAELSCSNIRELPYENSFFDALIEHATLVYNDWDTIWQACNECYRVLKPGGVGFFLLKRIDDCAFNDAKELTRNTFLVDESVFMSKKQRKENIEVTLRAFTTEDLAQMFGKFSKVRVHTWDLSFKAPHIDAIPGERKTAYWIVLVEK